MHPAMGFLFAGVFYSRAINDPASTGLFRNSAMRDGLPSLALLEDGWEAFQRAEAGCHRHATVATDSCLVAAYRGVQRS